MRPYQVYQQHKQPSMARIHAILALYNSAIDRLRRARALLTEQKQDAAMPLLTETALIVASLSAGMTGTNDPAELNFLRLYEFVAHQLTLKTPAAIEAARKVLATLLEGFEAVRDQAAAMEAHGEIAPVDRDNLVSVTA